MPGTGTRQPGSCLSLTLWPDRRLVVSIRMRFELQGLEVDRNAVFSKPLEYWDNQSVASIQVFLQNAKPTITRSLKQAKELGSFHTIEHYFPVRSPTIPEHLLAAILGNKYRPPPEPD